MFRAPGQNNLMLTTGITAVILVLLCFPPAPVFSMNPEHKAAAALAERTGLSRRSAPESPEPRASEDGHIPAASAPAGASSSGTEETALRSLKIPPPKIRLFGTVEFRAKLNALPKWINVLRMEQKNRSFSPDRNIRGTPWKVYKKKLASLPPEQQIFEVNRFFNSWPYKTDMQVWGVPDYWACPREFFQKSGDCEDYAIAKYFALRDLGFPPQVLRIVILKDTLRKLVHAVLVVFINGGALVLDNLAPQPLSHTKLVHYNPQSSVNEDYRWVHMRPTVRAAAKRNQ